MDINDYAANYASAIFGGGSEGLTNAMMYLNQATTTSNDGVYTYTYEFNGKNYGGQYYVENGVTGAASFSEVQLYGGGWKSDSDSEVIEFGQAQQGGPGDPPMAQAGIGLPIYYAVGEMMTALGLTAITYHANDHRSDKDNYLYVIKAYNATSSENVKDWKAFETIKYGISSDTGWRVRGQVNAYNRSGECFTRIRYYIIKFQEDWLHWLWKSFMLQCILSGTMDWFREINIGQVLMVIKFKLCGLRS